MALHNVPTHRTSGRWEPFVFPVSGLLNITVLQPGIFMLGDDGVVRIWFHVAIVPIGAGAPWAANMTLPVPQIFQSEWDALGSGVDADTGFGGTVTALPGQSLIRLEGFSGAPPHEWGCYAMYRVRT